jgi:putative membrane protein
MMEQPMQKILVQTVAALSLIPGAAWAPGPSDAERYGWGPHMMGWWGGGWYGMIFGPLFMILSFAVLVAVVVMLVRWLGGQWQGKMPHQFPRARTPLDILKERFARGEIDKDEFEDRRRVLGE